MATTAPPFGGLAGKRFPESDGGAVVNRILQQRDQLGQRSPSLVGGESLNVLHQRWNA